MLFRVWLIGSEFLLLIFLFEIHASYKHVGKGNVMRTYIYCRTEKQGVQTFYLNHYGKTYYLFTQGYRVSVRDYFQTGYIIDNGFDYSKTRGMSVRKTLDKIKLTIPYIEREYNIRVLRKTQRKSIKNYSKSTEKKYTPNSHHDDY